MNEQGEEVDKSLSRIAGEQCGGECKHSSTYHVVKIKNDQGGYDMACGKVDCRCMKFFGSGKPNTEAR